MKCEKHGELPDLELTCRKCVEARADEGARDVAIRRFKSESGPLYLQRSSQRLELLNQGKIRRAA